MIIGTVRLEEAIVFNDKQGFHSFTDNSFETGLATVEPYGSFEVFWFDAEDEDIDAYMENKASSGWFWWSCFAGCLPDGEKIGPFASSEQAYNDANEVD